MHRLIVSLATPQRIEHAVRPLLASLLLLVAALACTSAEEGAGDAGDDADAATGGGGTTSEERTEIEATSLLGEPLVRRELPGGTREDFQVRLEAAEAELAENPDDPDALIWVGRRTAYLGRYREAIDVFTRGVEQFPDDPRFRRHRGHRYISTRQLDKAIADLTSAASMIEGSEDQVEPDGLPNDRGVPTSSLHSNIWYHLGLAHYLAGDFDSAVEAYHHCLQTLDNVDHQVATRYWTYLALRRSGNEEAAAGVLEWVNADLDVFENQTYHQLLLFYRGEVSEDELTSPEAEALDLATTGYGVGAWYFVEGDIERAREQWTKVLETPQWAAFGYIAAEAEMARLEQ